MSFGLWVMSGLLAALAGYAAVRGQAPGPVIRRLAEQLAGLMPRLVLAFLAAGFAAELMPKEAIARLLGPEAGLLALPVAAASALVVPAGPMVAFSIAAVFAKAGATTAALITFVTAWSVFGIHRIVIYEWPLLGGRFTRMRLLSGVALPFIAGLIATVVEGFVRFGTPVPAGG